MATMKEVALRAGVSITSVSHVLNGTRFVSNDVRERIESAMRELSYVPSAVARSLKHNVTRTLGLMSPNNTNPYFAEVIRAIEDRCFASGYNLVLCNADDNPAKQSVYLQVLMEKRVDGLIVMAAGDGDDLPALLSRLTVPLVQVDREWSANGCDIVTVDHELGGYIATRHLIELGHRHIACIAGTAHLAPSKQRTDGWRRALAEAGLPEGEIVCGNFTSQGGREAMGKLLQQDHRPTAVFASNDLMAIGALCAAHEHGLRIPEQISVIGLDDIELSAYMSPPLTTVAQPIQRMGELAVDMMFERLNKLRDEPKKILLKPELRLRASTARPFGQS
jgi:LacI family transcriptional regulator